MRPLRLEIQAFGPFAQREVIDFTRLADDALFLIHGKTGSGKTTVLDAMCYALYGKTSGDERDGTDMRSHHASASLRTELLFDFALGDERYRVQRVPKQTRPKVRGEGVTTQQAEAAFYRIDEAGEELESLATGPSKVSDAVIERLQFNAEQFRQVVVLPQGRFRDLLAARSEERQKILEALFQTRRYRRVERALKDKARLVRKEAETLALQIEVRVEEAARLLNMTEDALRNDASLQTAWAELDLRLQDTRAREALARTRETSARTAMEQGAQVQQKLTALDEARVALKTCEQKTDEIARLRAALESARRAAPLRATRAAVERARKHTVEATEHAAAEDRRAEETGKSAAKAATELTAQATPEAVEAREAAARNVVRLESLQKTVARLAEVRATRVKADAEATAAEARSAAAAQSLKTAEAAGTAAREFLSEQKTLAAPHAELAAAAASAKALLTRHDQWTQARSQAEETSGERGSDQAALKTAGLALKNAEATLATARQQRHEARAALLAQGLEDNTPCPVCGSTDHPAPAQSKIEAPDDERLKSLEASAAKQARQREQAQVASTTSEARAAETASLVLGFERELGTATSQSRQQLEADWQSIEQRARTAAAAQSALDECRIAAERTHKAKEAAQGDATRARELAEQARLSREAASAAARTSAQDVPEALQTEAGLLQALQHSRSLSRDLQKSHLAAQETSEALAKKAAVAAQAARAAQETRRQREKECTELETAWTAALQQGKFKDTETWQAACLAPDAMDAVQKQIAGHDQALSAARDRAQRAAAEASEAGKGVAPDMEALRTSVEGAEAEVRNLADQTSGLERDAKQALRLRKKISEDRTACQVLEDHYGVVGRLAQVADGSNPQRLSFQRFVLASRLDEVLDVASQRLVEMTAGRYALRRREGTDDQRRAGGLEIDVDDNETGRPRPARTLSGGEGFLAALALSLATADVVTNHAGGIRLDAIFVDEGFGSLDDEALDRALKTLLSLHEDRRLVGVVSHVAELRERIDVRLEVVRGEVGSHARFVLP